MIELSPEMIKDVQDPTELLEIFIKTGVYTNAAMIHHSEKFSENSTDIFTALDGFYQYFRKLVEKANFKHEQSSTAYKLTVFGVFYGNMSILIKFIIEEFESNNLSLTIKTCLDEVCTSMAASVKALLIKSVLLEKGFFIKLINELEKEIPAKILKNAKRAISEHIKELKENGGISRLQETLFKTINVKNNKTL